MLSIEIQNAIEQEIEQRVHERMGTILKMISDSYKISFDSLLKDVATMKTGVSDAPNNICCGVLKNGCKCKNKTKGSERYCKRHESQKPPPPRKAYKIETSENSPFLQGLKNSKAKRRNVEDGDSSQVS